MDGDDEVKCPVCGTADLNDALPIAGVEHCENCYAELRRRGKIFKCAQCRKAGFLKDAYWCLDETVCDERCACERNDAIADARDYARLMQESKRW